MNDKALNRSERQFDFAPEVHRSPKLCHYMNAQPYEITSMNFPVQQSVASASDYH